MRTPEWMPFGPGLESPSKEYCGMDDLMLDQAPNDDTLFESIDAFSTPLKKQGAFAIILEEISHLRNSIRDHEAQILDFQAKIQTSRERIAACRKEMRRWELKQNRFSDIGRLPDDINLRIWEYLAHNAGACPIWMKDWLKVSHVCSRWRQLALSSPALWRWPCVCLPQLSWYLLSRSSRVPLTLVMDLTKIRALEAYDRREALDLARQLLHSTRKLCLRGDGHLSISPVFRLFSSALTRQQPGSAPSLTHVTIYYDSALPPPPGGGDINLANLTKSAPRLQKLVLYNRTLLTQADSLPGGPLDGPYSQLTSLVIALDKGSGAHHQHASLSKVLQGLRMLPHLKTLHLHHVFGPLGEDSVAFCRNLAQPISMAVLEHLTITATAQTARLFVAHVSYPTSTTCEFHGLWDEGGANSAHLDCLEDLLVTSCGRLGEAIPSLGLFQGQGYRIYIYPRRKLKTPRLRLSTPALPAFIGRLARLDAFKDLEVLTYKLDFSNIDIWEAFGTLGKLSEVCWEYEKHPALERVLSSFRPEGESIFEPPYHGGGGSSSIPQLYFDAATLFKAVSTGTNSSARFMAVEGFGRISAVRHAWTSLFATM